MMPGGGKVYRKLDAIEGRGPKLHVTHTERIDTDNEIRSAVRYCGKDNYLAFAFGVDESRVARIRKAVEAEPQRDIYACTGMYLGNIGPRPDWAARDAIASSTSALHRAIMKLYERRAKRDGSTVQQAAFSMGMRP